MTEKILYSFNELVHATGVSKSTVRRLFNKYSIHPEDVESGKFLYGQDVVQKLIDYRDRRIGMWAPETSATSEAINTKASEALEEVKELRELVAQLEINIKALESQMSKIPATSGTIQA